MNFLLKFLNMVNLQEYKRKLSCPGEKKVFKLPWARVVVTNVFNNGSLVKYKSLKHFQKKGIEPFAVCELKIFRDSDQTLYTVFKCSICRKMNGLENLLMNQPMNITEAYKCDHSKICDMFLAEWGHWTDVWQTNVAEITNDTEVFELRVLNNDEKIITLDEGERFIACVYDDNKNSVSLLSTLSQRMKVPKCFNCSVRPCYHLKIYKKEIASIFKQNNPGEEFPGDFYWTRSKDMRNRKQEPPTQYLEPETHSQFGFNQTKFFFPISEDENLSHKFQQHFNQTIILPEKFIPAWEQTKLCRHNSTFDPNDQNLVRVSPTVTKYNETSEEVLNIPIFARPSVANCKCQLEPDLAEYLLWNAGGGRAICYVFLLSSYMKMNHGVPINSQVNARKDTFTALGFPTSMTYNLFEKSFIGFCQLLQYKDEVWACPNCSETPPYLVCDGKATGVTKRKVSHISELDRHPTDDKPLSQGSNIQDRVYMAEKKDRDKFR